MEALDSETKYFGTVVSSVMKQRILIVEDDALHADGMSRALRNAGLSGALPDGRRARAGCAGQRTL